MKMLIKSILFFILNFYFQSLNATRFQLSRNKFVNIHEELRLALNLSTTDTISVDLPVALIKEFESFFEKIKIVYMQQLYTDKNIKEKTEYFYEIITTSYQNESIQYLVSMLKCAINIINGIDKKQETSNKEEIGKTSDVEMIKEALGQFIAEKVNYIIMLNNLSSEIHLWDDSVFNGIFASLGIANIPQEIKNFIIEICVRVIAQTSNTARTDLIKSTLD